MFNAARYIVCAGADRLFGEGSAGDAPAIEVKLTQLVGIITLTTRYVCPGSYRRRPNTVSEPTQAPSTNIGRCTLIDDCNTFPGFRVPATGC